MTLDTQPPKPSEPLIPHLQNGCINSTFPNRMWCSLSEKYRGFPGGAVVESLPASAGNAGSSPGLGGSHMPRSN